MKKILLLGGGKIGECIAAMLSGTGDYSLVVADRNPDMLKLVPDGGAGAPLEKRVLDVTDRAGLDYALAGVDTLISACPFDLNLGIAQAAARAGVHYFDLTEDVATTRAIRELAAGAGTAFMPQCGIAPGYISTLAHDLAKRFETLEHIQMRVGALPLYPTNAFKYNLTWSTDGLINEYCNPCEVIHEGAPREVLPLGGLEEFSLDGVTYEAFNTSGGLGTLCDTLAGRVDFLDYKTVRYPGHCAAMRMLLRDLRLAERRDLLKDVLETAVPITKQDVVLAFVTISGMQGGRLTQESHAQKIYSGQVEGGGETHFSAIQISTAAGACAMVDLFHGGKLPQQGFLRQEDATLSDFLANRFGRYYA
ncbi:MAG: saccharopine dehydrogenase NADP-binding domain-containing protein [Deltaproteobacteria bacterium]|nr:saccharopine dehydrogenase NADP-binding domain-containing protein [Deltaproteobacteria bacterium]